MIQEQKEIIKLTKGDEVNHFFLLRKCDVKVGKTNKSYLNMEFGDKSASVSANLWDKFEDFLSTVKVGEVIKVKGSVDEFNGQNQIRISEIRLAIPSDGVTVEDFLPKSARDPEIMQKELKNRIDAVKNDYLRDLLKLMFSGEQLEKFSRMPAGKSWHHSYIHGLIEHTLEIVRICDLMCDIHPEVNRDLVVSGAFLHDYGKIEELTSDASFEYTDKGKLLGHITICAMEISDKVRRIKDFPAELKNQLIHLILSHQGKLEFASPVEPKTLEAAVLYHADELSAKTNAYKKAILAEKHGSNRWTKFLPLINTALYIPDDSESETRDNNLFNQ
jgi:3'-5' exoribonuclease